ncbi:MAG: class I SAM-dependent methyltransferase [bacterium]
MNSRSMVRRGFDYCLSALGTGAVLLLSHTVGVVVGLVALVLRLERPLRRVNRWSCSRFPSLHWGDVLRLVPAEAVVLDVGAGDCLLAGALRKVRRARVTCADIADRSETDIPVTVFDGVHLPFPDRSYDVVLLSYVLHHAERGGDLLRECARTCRGRVLVVEDLPLFGRRFYEWGHHRMYNCLVRRPDGIEYGRIRLRYDGEWRELFEDAGLEVAAGRLRWSNGSFPMMRAIYELVPAPVARPD